MATLKGNQSTLTTRTRPQAAPVQIPFTDLLVQWINVSKVHKHLQEQEQKATRLQLQLDDLLRRKAREGVGERRQGVNSTNAAEGEAAGQSNTNTAVPSSLLSEGFTPITPLSPGSPEYLSPPAITSMNPFSARKLALSARRANLQRLQAKVQHDTNVLHALRTTVLQKRQALLPRLNMIQQLQSQALQHRDLLAAERKKLAVELKVQLHLLHLRCSFRRRVLLHNLATIYPISPPKTALRSSQTLHPLMCYTIRGLRLPNNFNNILTSFDEEQVSTALGYVCHLLLMVSKYLEVPLRYRMLYRSSRSVICDDITASSQFPLYFKNMEERRFEIGVILLNKNIEHLLNVRIDSSNPLAKYVRELTFTLENLDVLFKSEVPQ